MSVVSGGSADRDVDSGNHFGGIPFHCLVLTFSFWGEGEGGLRKGERKKIEKIEGD